MSVFDLVFIGVFLGAVGYGVWILTLLLRRRWAGLRLHSIRWAVAAGLYMAVVVAVGLSSTRKVLPPDEILRYDDWCLGVQQETLADAIGGTPADPGSRFLIATVAVSSTAGRPQAAPQGALVYILDDRARYDVEERVQAAFEKLNGAQPELTTRLDPHGSFLTRQVFVVPRGAKELFLGHRHGSGSRFPAMLIIGTGFGKASVIRLQPR